MVFLHYQIYQCRKVSFLSIHGIHFQENKFKISRYLFLPNFSDSEKPIINQDVADPTGPAARKGVLISFRTGKSMEIPEKDIVSQHNLNQTNRPLICESLIKTFLLFQLGRCRFVGEFEKLNRIGEGTYGIVCKFS